MVCVSTDFFCESGGTVGAHAEVNMKGIMRVILHAAPRPRIPDFSPWVTLVAVGLRLLDCEQTETLVPVRVSPNSHGGRSAELTGWQPVNAVPCSICCSSRWTTIISTSSSLGLTRGKISVMALSPRLVIARGVRFLRLTVAADVEFTRLNIAVVARL